MLNWIFAVAILFTSNAIFSQTVDFKWGATAAKSGDYFSDKVQFVTETDNGYYYFGDAKRNFNTNGIFIYGFNKDLTPKEKTRVDFPESSFGKTSFIDVFDAGKRGVMFFYASNGNEMEIFATEVIESGQEVTFKHKSIYKGVGVGTPMVAVSEDKSKFVITRPIKPVKGSENKPHKIAFHVIDGSLNAVWQGEQEPENFVNKQSFYQLDLDISVSNTGDVALVFYQKDPSFSKSIPSENTERRYFTCAIYIVTESGKKSSTYKPKFGNYSIWGIVATFHNNELLCAAKAYDVKEAEYSYEGFLTFKMDTKGTVSNDKITRLNQIDEFVKLKPQGNVAFSRIKIKTASGKYYVSYESYSGARGTTSSMYSAEGAILMLLDGNFKMEWTQYINKFQATTNENGSHCSFATLYNPANSSTVVLYTAFGKDKNVEKDYREENGYTYQIIVDANGKMTKKPIFDAQADGTILSPDNLVQTTDGSYIVLSERKVNFQLAKLTFK